MSATTTSDDYRYAYEGALEDIMSLHDYCLFVARNKIPEDEVAKHIAQFLPVQRH